MKNLYAYKLSGVNADWVYSDASHRSATYTKLAPGEYIFRVKGSNNDGIWNENGTSLKIVILPPWYRSKIAYAFYLLAFLGLVAGTWKWQVNRLKSEHQRELEHLEAEKLKEIDQAKSRFFANISHEFRTPLTLIEGPIKQLLQGEFAGNLKEQYQLILRNSKRLLDLVNQLLDLSKLEAGRMKLHVKKQDIIPLLRGLVQSFESLARRKNIEFSFQCTPDERLHGIVPQHATFIDAEKLEKIIDNLLSNAFKFTPDGGQVGVVVSYDNDGYARRGADNRVPTITGILPRGMDRRAPASDVHPAVIIAITNTGPGIPADKINHIFDRFYQVDDSQTRHHEGTGIGLALVQELVELHHGQITVTSEPGKLTTFTVMIPIDQESYDESEICRDEILEPMVVYANGGSVIENTVISTDVIFTPDLPLYAAARITAPLQNRTHPRPAKKPLPVVLIVDDNSDVRQYIGGLLNPDCRIMEAENGEQGISAAKQSMPDLVISDVMMPGMDGYELCRKIKTDLQISHIPVILLTARAEESAKLQGLETGADDYLTKPFEARELQLRVRNIIRYRKQLQEKFNQDLYIKPKDITVTSLDEKFLEKIIQMINEQISDSDLNVEKLSNVLNMSRIQLWRKVKALLGLTPVALVRRIRIQRAKELLEHHFGNVSQVAYEVGFNNISYFSKCFQKQFGIHPSLSILK